MADKVKLIETQSSHPSGGKDLTGSKVTVQKDGKKMDVKFSWIVDSPSRGSWASFDFYDLQIEVADRKFLLPRKVFSKTMRVGESLWEAYKGSNDKGPQNFEQCMKTKGLFDKLPDDSPVKPFLEQARKDTARAIQDMHERDIDWQVSNIRRTDPEVRMDNNFSFDQIRNLGNRPDRDELRKRQTKRLSADSLVAKSLKLKEGSWYEVAELKAAETVAKVTDRPLTMEEIREKQVAISKARQKVNKERLVKKYGKPTLKNGADR